MNTVATTDAPSQDSALADLTERTYSDWQARSNAADWLKVRGLQRAGNITHQNAKDLRRRLGRNAPGESQVDEEMRVNSPTINHPAPVIFAPQPQSSGVGKALVGAAITAGLLGIPAAGIIGYGISQLMEKTPAATTDDNTLDIGLGRFEDLKE